jgi:hypothetical protein
MRQFSVARLLQFASIGGVASGKLELEKLFPTAGKDIDLIKETVFASSADYRELEADCVNLELVSSLATIKKLQALQTKPSRSYTALSSLLLELEGRLIDETQTKVFWALSIRESELYSNPRKGWEEIIEHFPSSVIDVEEASRCFALSRYAAAVFHSVQVVEVWLIELGKLIGVTDPKSGWTATTNRLSGIIKKGHEARTPYEREHFTFFEQIQGTIEGLKNAWRNKVSHAQDRLALLAADFTPDIAEEILFATRAFMRRLATEAPPSADASPE